MPNRIDDNANSTAALPRTAMRRAVWPTPRTKNSGVTPTSAAAEYNAVKPRTLPYARMMIDLRIFRSALGEGPRDQMPLTKWKIDATSAPVFDIVIAGFGPLGRLVSQPESSEVEPHASAPLPKRTKNGQPFCM